VLPQSSRFDEQKRSSELRALTDDWLRIYNRERPTTASCRVPPLTFLPRPSSAAQSPIELSA
jgi:hypothetical protein